MNSGAVFFSFTSVVFFELKKVGILFSFSSSKFEIVNSSSTYFEGLGGAGYFQGMFGSKYFGLPIFSMFWTLLRRVTSFDL